MNGDLPQGWISAPLGEIADINPRHPKGIDDSMPVTFVPMTAVSESKPTFQFTEERPLGEIRKGFTHFREGDVLFAKITPCMENGKGAIATGLRNGLGCGTTELHVIRPLAEINPNYIYRFLSQPLVRHAAKDNFTGTAGQLRVPTSFIEQLEVPLPPLAEQQRIVAKLELLLGQVDTCQKRLDKIPTLLKRFRQAVLAAACFGRLTEDWREENVSNSDGNGLLKHILSEKKARWEAKQLQKLSAKGKRPKGDLWKSEYEETKQPSTDDLPEIPQSWTWIALASLVTRVKRGPSMKCNQEAQGVRYITSGNLENGNLCLDYDQKYLTGFDEIEKCRLLPGDLILNCVNSLEKIGKSAVFEAQHGEAIVGFNNYALELEVGFVRTHYLNLFCQSDSFRRQLHLVVKHAINQVSFATEELDLLAVSLPPLEEQQEIVRRVERLFALADNIEQRYKKAQAFIDKLTPSLLAKAFRGELVPQDPNDEPASVLLGRIGADKEKGKPQSKSKKSKR